MHQNNPKLTNNPLIVFYNDKCSLCCHEIDWYRGLKPRAAIDWIPLSEASQQLESYNLRFEEAVQRLHVVLPDGQLVHSVAAFVAIWQRLVILAPLAWIVRLPGVFQLVTACYHLWLKYFYRPQY